MVGKKEREKEGEKEVNGKEGKKQKGREERRKKGKVDLAKFRPAMMFIYLFRLLSLINIKIAQVRLDLDLSIIFSS